MKSQIKKIKGLKIFKGKNFYDSRGFFREIFMKKKVKEHKPIFWCTSKSKKNVLRGLHLQTKIVRKNMYQCLKVKY